MASPKAKQKLFDLDQANRTLPLVSRIVDDIVRVNGRIWALHEEAEKLVSEGSKERAEELQDQMQDRAYERAEFVDELEKIGCVLKDADGGLVDFPTRLEGRVVLLCWKRGESEISFWHDLTAGFRGRQPVEGLEFSS